MNPKVNRGLSTLERVSGHRKPRSAKVDKLLGKGGLGDQIGSIKKHDTGIDTIGFSVAGFEKHVQRQLDRQVYNPPTPVRTHHPFNRRRGRK